MKGEKEKGVKDNIKSINHEQNDEADKPSGNKEWNEILNRLRLQLNISETASKYKKEILADVNRKIDEHSKRRVFIRRIVAMTTGVAAMLTLGVFILTSNFDNINKTLLAELTTVDLEEVKEISIVSGEKQEKVINNEKIIQTKDGNIVVGKSSKLQAEEIKTEYVTIAVPKGKRTSIQLSDGSMVWINSGSKLRFPKIFDKNIRKIYLDGEIYIEVAKDVSRPFEVHTDAMEIKVLGTRFNVNAYKGESTSSVVLVEGSVETKSNKQKTVLQPGQGYFKKEGNTTVQTVNTYSYICWKDGRLKLIDEPFNALLRKLSRYYDIEIACENNLNSLRFEGNLALKDSIEDILRTLSVINKFTFEKDENNIVIKAK